MVSISRASHIVPVSGGRGDSEKTTSGHYGQLSVPMQECSSPASQTFHFAKEEEKSGNLPIPFWFAEFGIICVA